jgi:hypothetical protein
MIGYSQGQARPIIPARCGDVSLAAGILTPQKNKMVIFTELFIGLFVYYDIF